MIYFYGCQVFKDEESARECAKKRICWEKKYREKFFEGECTEIVEKIEREENKETHTFSFIALPTRNCNKTFVISISYIAKENRRRKGNNNEKHRKTH